MRPRQQLLRSDDLTRALKTQIHFDRIHAVGTSFYLYKNRKSGRSPIIVRVSNHMTHNVKVDLDLNKGRWRVAEIPKVVEEVKSFVKIQSLF